MLAMNNTYVSVYLYVSVCVCKYIYNSDKANKRSLCVCVLSVSVCAGFVYLHGIKNNICIPSYIVYTISRRCGIYGIYA